MTEKNRPTNLNRERKKRRSIKIPKNSPEIERLEASIESGLENLQKLGEALDTISQVKSPVPIENGQTRRDAKSAAKKFLEKAEEFDQKHAEFYDEALELLAAEADKETPPDNVIDLTKRKKPKKD